MEKKSYTTSSTTSESNYKNNLEALQKEVKQLKSKLDNFERENKDLKKSIYDLTARYDMLVHQSGRGLKPFNIDSVLSSAPQSQASTIATAGSGGSKDSAITTGAVSGIGGGLDSSSTIIMNNSGGPGSNGSSGNNINTNSGVGGNSGGGNHHLDVSTTIPSPPPSLVSDVVSSDDRLLSLSNQQRGTSNKKMDERHFYYKFTLKGHSASVYTIDYSPCGKLLASGSFDKSVKIWDVYNQRELATFSEHNVNVSKIAWNNNSTEILSGSYDKSVKLWDLHSNKLISSYNTSGFVLDVMFSPIDNNLFFAGNTQNHVIGFDKRTPNSISIIANDSLINALHVFKDGQHILTGDAMGKLKVWDIKKATKTNLPEVFYYEGGVDGLAGSHSLSTPIDSYEIAPENRPISAIAISRGSEDDGRFLAVNSYDNVLRVYDRSKVSIVSHPYSLSPITLIHSLTGHKNKNYPIKSSIFVGKDYIYEGSSNSKREHESMKSVEEEDEEDTITEDINQSVLLATGSADYNAYIFDIGYSKQSGKMLQKLEGHTDRVYSVKFHPSEPILASCSADSTIRLWTPKKKIFN
eukprot:gene9285-11381_t